MPRLNHATSELLEEVCICGVLICTPVVEHDRHGRSTATLAKYWNGGPMHNSQKSVVCIVCCAHCIVVHIVMYGVALWFTFHE